MNRFPVAEIRSVELGTPDLARSEAFYTEVWGLAIQDRDADAVYLRASGPDHHVLALRSHHSSVVLSITFRAASEAHLHALVQSVQDAGGMVMKAVAPNSAPDGGIAATVRTPDA